MKSDKKTLYIAGVAVLVVLVVVGLVWRGDSSSTTADGGTEQGSSNGHDGATADGAVADAALETEDEADGGDQSNGPGDSSNEPGDTEEEPVAAEPIPDDPDECRAYCEGLAERNALAEGATASTCVEQVCGGDSNETEDDSEPVPTMGQPSEPELPEECQAQCRALQERGELRDGMTLEDCHEALCSSGEEEESAE